MMTFVNMDRDGLVILPTHRVVHSLPSFDPKRFIAAVQTYFSVEPVAANTPDDLIARLKAVRDKTAFVAVTSAGNFLLAAKPEAAQSALKDIPERRLSLDTVQLHALVLEKTLGITPEAIGQQTNVRYVRDATEAIEQVAQKTQTSHS